MGRQVQLQVRSENSLTGKEDAGFMEKPELFLYADIVHNCTLILKLSRDQFNRIDFLKTFPHNCICMLYPYQE